MRAVARAAAALCAALAIASAGRPANAGDDPLARGRELLRAGDHSGAAAAFRDALGAGADEREARLGLARALSFSGDHEGGEREYRALLEVRPGDVEARLGLADVLAWRRRYAESQETLRALESERPADPEVLVRRGRVALWSGDRATARAYFEKTLAVDPENADAKNGMAAVEAVTLRLGREAEAGVSLLRIRRANPGTQAWAGLRDRRRDGWEYLGRFDYLHRYGEDEVRATAGALRRLDGGRTARIEAALSPGADVFARAAAELEFGMPLAAGLAGSASGKYSHYGAADVWNASAGLEYYPVPRLAVLGRYVFARTSFDAGGRSNDGTVLLKATRFFSDDDRAWVYYSRGSEGYAAGTIDQVGRVRADTYGAGGRWYPVPRWGVEANVDWQERDDGNRFVTFTLAAYRRY